jgi:hypothetical protein
MAEDHDFEAGPKRRINLRILCKSPGDCAETQDIVNQRDNRRSRDGRGAIVDGKAVICRSNSNRFDVLCGSNRHPKDTKPHDGEGAHNIFVAQVHRAHSEEEEEGGRGYGNSKEPYSNGKYLTAVPDRSG